MKKPETMPSDQDEPELDERDRQLKVEVLRRERPANPSSLNPDKPQFKLTTLLVATTAACIIAGAIATQNLLLGLAAFFIVWVAVGTIEAWVTPVIERWIGDE